MSLKDKIIERLSTKPEPAPATFFNAPTSDDTSANAKPAKARKTRAKAVPAGSQPAPVVDNHEPLQQSIEHPHAAMMRALSQVEVGNSDEQPTSATRTDSFRRPSLYNNMGLRSNGPMMFSTHRNQYDEQHGRAIVAERDRVREAQERRAWAGIESLGRMLASASKNLRPPRRKAS